MLLRLDAGRAFLQRDAVDRGAAGHAQRRAGLVDAARALLGRVGVDHQDAVGHARILSLPIVLSDNAPVKSTMGALPMLHRRLAPIFAAALLLAGSALAQNKLPPLRTGVDGTFAPHAMPKLGGG